MTKFTKQEQIRAFYLRGKNCIESSEKLLGKSLDFNSCFDILLIHGIELILAAFIMSKDSSSNPKSIYRKFGHKYWPMFLECKKLDKNFADPELEAKIHCLSHQYAQDIIEVRFPDKSGMKSFPLEIFSALKEKLVKPLKNLV